MQKAKEAGYEITLAYITTQDPNINLKRVMRRKEEGGHDVPPDKTVSRYEKSLNLLPEAFKIADKARVYNNSFDSPVLLVEKTLDKRIILYPQKIPSKWDKQKIKALVGIDHLKMKNPSDLPQTKEHNKLDKYNILQAPAIKELPEKPDDKTLFNAYAKAVLDETDQKWTDKTNQLIAEKMLKNKDVSSDQVKRALKHSPEKIDNTSLFVRKIENTPEIKSIRKTSRGMEM